MIVASQLNGTPKASNTPTAIQQSNIDDPKKLKTLLQASFLPQRQASQLGSQIGLDYDAKNSSMAQKVFTQNGKPIVVYRGSKTLADWITNPLALAGIDTQKEKNAQRLNKRLTAEYGTTPINVGYSRGGFTAERASKSSPVITYNKLTSIPSIFKGRTKGQIDYRTNLDIPSSLSQYQKGGTLKNIAGSYNPIESHSTKYL